MRNYIGALALTMAMVSLSAACAVEADDAALAAQEAELGDVFRSELFDLGALPLEARKISYPEDARPFDDARPSVSQRPGESRYVSYTIDAKKGDGLLFAANKTSATETSGSCDEIVRVWLLDENRRIVRAGSSSCASEYEVPGLQSSSKILRHYFESAGSYRLVVAVLPASGAAATAPIRTQPWKFVALDVVRSHEENQGAAQSRCQDGTDILCRAELRCERARCK